MNYLILTTIVWAFSFSLIGAYLAGQVDPWFSAMSRTCLASLLFIPFLIASVKKSNLDAKSILALMTIGGIQLGVMYGFYYQSFLLLSVPEVLFFTIFTPIYIMLIHDILAKKFSKLAWGSAVLSVIGAWIIKSTATTPEHWFGFLMVQAANVCFALGQVTYKHLYQHRFQSISQHYVFGWFYIGASLVSILSYSLFGNSEKLPQTSQQWLILLYLGLVASGAGYFLWNVGATKVKASTLAVMNNMLIPAGIFVNIWLWERSTDTSSLLIGSVILITALSCSELPLLKILKPHRLLPKLLRRHH